MNIANRLIILLAVPLVALTSLAIYVHLSSGEIERRSRFVSENQIPSLAVIGSMSRIFDEMRVLVRDNVFATDAAPATGARAKFEKALR
ncbi:MAG: hypothetical protein EXS32_04015 [Opitutus sp.]|nr:hypothetical protein [Opitutus sp.]